MNVHDTGPTSARALPNSAEDVSDSKEPLPTYLGELLTRIDNPIHRRLLLALTTGDHPDVMDRQLARIIDEVLFGEN
jgi:hypothetical protein